MKQEELKKLLYELRSLPSETEWVEFKKAATNFHFNDIGKYFSALSKTIVSLDRIQKREKLDKEEYKKLKKQGLVEGRYPSIFVVSKIAAITGDKSRYIKNRAFDKQHYKKMIIELIKKFGSTNRKDIDDLLWSKLSDVLNEKQKKIKINNLLSEMVHKDRTIKNEGSDKKPKWVLR